MRTFPTEMPRLVSTSLLSTCRHLQSRPSIAARRLFASTQADDKGSQNSTPGWEGRHGDDHAVKRDRHDVQGDASQEGMKQHQEGKEGSQAISRKDEGSYNKKAEEEHPKAPKPVIGMNDERGSVSDGISLVEASLLKLDRKGIDSWCLVDCIGAFSRSFAECRDPATFRHEKPGCRSYQPQSAGLLPLSFRRLLR